MDDSDDALTSALAASGASAEAPAGSGNQMGSSANVMTFKYLDKILRG